MIYDLSLEKLKGFDYKLAVMEVWFRCFCRANNKNQKDYHSFNDFMKTEKWLFKNINDFWIKKYFFEKLFNFKFEFDHEILSWNISWQEEEVNKTQKIMCKR